MRKAVAARARGTFTRTEDAAFNAGISAALGEIDHNKSSDISDTELSPDGKCGRCNGTGEIPNGTDSMACRDCIGTGEAREHTELSPAACSKCKGTGKHNCSIPEHACAYCGGTGKVACSECERLKGLLSQWLRLNGELRDKNAVLLTKAFQADLVFEECERLREALSECRKWIKAKLGLAEGQTNDGWDESPLRVMIDTALTSKPKTEPR